MPSKYGPSAVTATAIHVVKAAACKVLGIPPARALAMPKFTATPNRAKFSLVHPSLPLDRSLVDIRQEMDKEVDRIVKADKPVNVYTNMTVQDALRRFGDDVLDRYYDIDEPNLVGFLNEQYFEVFGRNMFNNWFERKGTKHERYRYKVVDGIPVDMRVAVQQFLEEIGGSERDLLSRKTLKFLKRKKAWMEHNDQWPSEEDRAGRSDLEVAMKREWSHMMNKFNRVTDTDWEDPDLPDKLRVACVEVPDVGVGLALGWTRSPYTSSATLAKPCHYLRSTGQLGKVVVTQARNRRYRQHEMRVDLDVFPGYDERALGPNPYVMFRENFDLKQLASIIPYDHELTVPDVGEPIDFQKLLGEEQSQTGKEEKGHEQRTQESEDRTAEQ